ncbi:type I restriction-modification system subunit M N-terminal domain-containing protein [Candidatus Nitrotoga fabula]|uniref:Site-specific DNA-methyltransferase (Adenine-specific) n=1 Tax=Candidatus Nitrotoga fabula TaxID=2182327 RepID=A0A916BD99_9PROT|nr:type I restriction-modification system subunit M N-terminal domain-containing protein [Candidatus Nitrotoga fabula]CAE6715012.1 putative Site-specific DNA-methyltransferase (adenine-specific) [Candidatus Nitrotoga fabula]
MNTETHRQLANDIWSICNLLRGPYKRNEYRKVILPLTVLRRFDCLLAPTKGNALQVFNQYKGKPESIIRSVMQSATGYPFYNLSKLEFAPSQQGRNSLLDDPSNLAPNFNSYINGYEIPLNRHFYRYESPRELAVIEKEIKALEADIVRLLGEVTE